ncbi:hypothetical protein [Rhizobium sp. BK176]|uniref:hypothetical protein n=1 Tax=Rhizobium sp. BK176 TaxID=2587071 RepID=UPI002169EC5E|nr:hypothetical protein [Rhizobium sp. BK176]MCS4089140.1 hypothetical protein [Rhizobium sp. BK176]
MADKVEPHAKIISALSGTMSDRMWPDELLTRCRQMREAIEEIEKIARSNVGGSR